MPQRLVVDPQNTTFQDLAPAARTLLDGGLVAGPTGTFYALMTIVDNTEAMDRLVSLKGADQRQDKAFLIMLDQKDRVGCYAKETPEEAEGLMTRFWPGPLTLLFLAHNGLPSPLLGPARTVGVRVESLPIVRRLVRMIDRGVTGTSANLAGQPAPTTADQVLGYFGDSIDLIIDGGPTTGGQPSTVIDVSLGSPRVMRDGGLPIDELLQACPILRFKS